MLQVNTETVYFLLYHGIITGCIAIIFWFISTIWSRWVRNFPPGPVGLPIVGYLPFVTKSPYLKFIELGKKYGPVFSLRMGSENIVVLNTAKVIKEAFNKAEFLGRPPKSIFTLIERESPFFLNGKVWQEQRRFSIHALRDLGLGKSRIQELIKEEIQYFINTIESQNGNACDIKQLLTPSISNNICSLVFGSRYAYDSEERKLLDRALYEATTIIEQTAIQLFLPWTKYILFWNKASKHKRLLKAIDSLFDFIESEIHKHRETLDPSSIRDYIDNYLMEMKTRLKQDPSTTLSDYMLSGSVAALFGAGSETVSTSINWCLYVMAAYKYVQKKVQEEIDNVIGRERAPDFSDLKAMPYIHSVIMEIQRWRTIAPLGVFRCTVQNTTIGGYNIPKDTVIISNLWAAHHDPTKWTNPENFIPERFLNDDGQSVIKPEDYMPFSVGKRACPGESLAMMEMFLYIAFILQRFNIELSEKHVIDFEGVFATTYSPKPYKLYLIAREK